MSPVRNPPARRNAAKAAMAMVVAILVLAVVAALAVFVLSPNSTTSTSTSSYAVTSDPSPYFPNGYDSVSVNFSGIHNGDVLTVGSTSIRYYIPSNLETRTTTISSTTTTITVTADYQCGHLDGAAQVLRSKTGERQRLPA